MISTRVLNVFIRFFIVIFWVILLFLFLNLPHISKLLYRERSLSIFTWSVLLDPIYLKQFEKETGIKLYISYYEANEELLSKMQATKGKGYDIIFPSDYMLVILRKKGFLKKIDKTRLNFWDKLDTRLLNHYFDPNNEYSIPYFWGLYGIGVDREYYGGKIPEATWGLLFNPQVMPARVGMTDNIRESIYIAAQYLFGSIDALKDPANLEKVKDLLIQQKKRVEAYSEVRSEEMLLAKSCPVVVGVNIDIWRAKRENPDIAFLIPKEGSFLNIDSIVIPKASDKEDLVYEFINYLYRDDVFAHHVEEYGLCPTIVTIEVDRGNFCPIGKPFELLRFLKDIIPKRQLNEVWLAVMAS